ncbi:hypothetical protein HN592_04495 [Candidatus Woesearchaeota archaeon]|nr:hypothetical protein [Candidatus Woesearchaeota archaeon]MBT4368471.1 hypothetical protein [Candidatus Woesearchaeota archaeon]MBT4712960.1 hypothetical protein [Candidatus Woesearchaeota archaeon]MBT6639872.1 hypothetical protein [Candidatus Woesearchaeota archaeon]MBT7134044.1 hypothetical protein [Candidatus Woesearchaeota archaeon]
MIKKEQKTERITAYTFSAQKVTDLTKAHTLLCKAFKERPIGTYGGVNTDTLYEAITRKGYDITREEICAKDDEDVGLHMPNFWPINIGEWAMSIAMYYSYMQMRYTSGFPTFPSWNRQARTEIGWESTIEVYDLNRLTKRLETNEWPFFSSPLTLTECMRHLEGWQMRRLNAYKEYSRKIEAWAKKQPFYDATEWHLGREQSKRLMQKTGQITNVRYCVKRFWQDVLTQRELQEGDRELDIVTPLFSQDRMPDLMLVGEDFFETDGRFTPFDPEQHSTLTFKYNFQSRVEHTNPVRKEDPKQHNYMTAQIATEQHPHTNVVLLSFDPQQRKLFKLIKEDGTKEGLSLEVILASAACLDYLGVNILKEVETCLS